MLDSTLDQLDSLLDHIEQKNDDLFAKLQDLLESNKETRVEMQSLTSESGDQDTSDTTDKDSRDDTDGHKPAGQWVTICWFLCVCRVSHNSNNQHRTNIKHKLNVYLQCIFSSSRWAISAVNFLQLILCILKSVGFLLHQVQQCQEKKFSAIIHWMTTQSSSLCPIVRFWHALWSNIKCSILS